MNFVKHQQDIQNDILHPKGKISNLKFSGIYIFSRLQDDNVFKIGMSESDLFRRLVTHKSCYPFQSEYWLQYLVICNDTEYRDEKSNRKKSDDTRKLEKAILASPHLKNFVEEEKITLGIEQGKRAREYRAVEVHIDNTKKKQSDEYEDAQIVFATKDMIRKKLSFALKETLNNNAEAGALNWFCIISFGQDSWRIMYNDYGINGEAPISERMLADLVKPPRTGRERIDVSKMENLILTLNRGLKIGDRVWVLEYKDNTDVTVYKDAGTIIGETQCYQLGYIPGRKIGKNNKKVDCWRLQFPNFEGDEGKESYPKNLCYKYKEDAEEASQKEQELQQRGFGYKALHHDTRRSLIHAKYTKRYNTHKSKWYYRGHEG
jgi:hypothetical protein